MSTKPYSDGDGPSFGILTPIFIPRHVADSRAARAFQYKKNDGPKQVKRMLVGTTPSPAIHGASATSCVMTIVAP